MHWENNELLNLSIALKVVKSKNWSFRWIFPKLKNEVRKFDQ